ncbi:hypothetical protein [Actinoplanes sp. CA-252034]|uniref:hypothetical protein n=1 Tax=Actinoplanes sp. CA-252034 TaxID=3239906 RepID=UPI003D951F88
MPPSTHAAHRITTSPASNGSVDTRSPPARRSPSPTGSEDTGSEATHATGSMDTRL